MDGMNKKRRPEEVSKNVKFISEMTGLSEAENENL